MTISMEKPYVVGMDIGGTNTVFGIVDSRGNVLSTDSIKTQQYEDVEEYVDAVCKKLVPLVQAVGGTEKIKGMGVGAPNGNFYNGTIEFAPNLPWKGIIPLAAMFEDKLGIPTAIVDRNGRQCNCGRKGCLETYCSATGVARTAREFLVQRTEPSLLRNIPSEEIASKDVYDAAVKGDKLALDIFEFTGRILGEALANFIAFSSPEAIVLFGGLAKSGDYIMKPIKKAIDDNILKIYAGKTRLLLSQLKDADAAVLGASALGWEVKED